MKTLSILLYGQTYIQMFYKAIIWEKMGENPGLQLEIAKALGISQQAVQKGISKKSDTLTKYSAVMVISKWLEMSVEDLFEMEPA